MHNHVSISTIAGNKIAAHTPYNPAIIERFKLIGGRWDKSADAWTFDDRSEARVRAALIDVFGTDGESPVELVTMRVEFNDEFSSDAHSAIFIAGREIARAWGRDSGARLGDGVVVVEGLQPQSGGSVKNWRTKFKKGTVIEVRDVPRKAVDAAIAEFDYATSMVITAVGDDNQEKAALESRRDALLKELAEVEAKLSELA